MPLEITDVIFKKTEGKQHNLEQKKISKKNKSQQESPITQ
jgi:hypothetical protein